MCKEYPPLYISTIRLHNSYVLSQTDSFETVASSLFGVQSQIFNASAIAFAIRTKCQTFSQFKHVLDTLSLVRLWGIRTTLHIYHRDDWSSLLAYLSTVSNWYRAKAAAQGVDIDSIVDMVLTAINGADYFDREFLIDRGIDKEHLGPWGDLLIELSNRGYIFLCNDFQNNDRLFGNTQAVFGMKMESSENLLDVKRELALRFFRAYAPATIHDFAHWLGITVREAEKYFLLVRNRLVSVRCGDKEYYIELANRETFDKIFQERANDTDYYLLPKFDPLLLAYRDKTWIAEEYLHKKIWKVAGHVEGVVLQRGKAIATWRYRLKNKAVNFEVSPFRRRFSTKRMEKSCSKIALFFERPIGNIVCKEDFL